MAADDAQSLADHPLDCRRHCAHVVYHVALDGNLVRLGEPYGVGEVKWSIVLGTSWQIARFSFLSFKIYVWI